MPQNPRVPKTPLNGTSRPPRETLPAIAPPLIESTLHAPQAASGWLERDTGIVLLREIMERTGILQWVTLRLTDPHDHTTPTCPPADLPRTGLWFLPPPAPSPHHALATPTEFALPTTSAPTRPAGAPQPAAAAAHNVTFLDTPEPDHPDVAPPPSE